jgi:hypothetical protein
MFDLQHGQKDDVLQLTAGRMAAAQAKWDRLTPADLSAIKHKTQLIDRVEQRYSLPHEQAARDVEIWVADTRF